jgi:hypothetical protein
LTTGVVSTGTVAGLATLVANGSVDSTAGITGAVSLTGSASLAGTTGASSDFFSVFSLVCENCDFRVPKMLLRLVGAGLASTGAAVSSVAGTTGSVTAGVATGAGWATAGAVSV